MVYSICLIGLTVVLLFTLKVCRTIYYEIAANFRYKIKDYILQNGSYAVITGCTDGIGKAYAIQLASMGSNLILVGRGSRLTEISAELNHKYKVDVVALECDFSNVENIVKLEPELLKRNIYLLINNVGVGYKNGTDFFNRVEIENINRLLDVNCHSYCLMTKMVLPQMIEKKNGIIVNVSSCTSFFSLPYLSMYAASKSFIDTFTFSLMNEYPEAEYGIHFHCLNPFFVASKLSGMRPSFYCPTADKYASSSLNYCLTGSGSSSGYWVHTIIIAFICYIPSFIVNYYSTKYTRFVMKKLRARKAQ